VLVLVAENVGHVKAVAAMTGRPLDDVMGRALMGDGLSTTLAGSFGGSGTTTYAENIGVMAATRIYSSAAYVIAGGFAVALSLSPKVGALIASIPQGVLGGVTFVLYGLIAVLGAKIWLTAGVDLSDPVVLMTGAVGITLGAANVTVTFGQYAFTGIAVGSIAAVAIYHVLRAITRWRGTGIGTGSGVGSADRDATPGTPDRAP
jgi:xanthine/uracil permease